MAVVFVGEASATVGFGVGVLKDCTTPINVGDPYSCEVELDNLSQGSHASVRVTSLTDVVFAAGGQQSQTFPINSNSFSLLGGMIKTGGATCDATGCTVPYGGTLSTPFFSHYAATVADFPSLGDQATYTWNEICSTSIIPGCNAAANHNQATASADINPVPTTTTTSINSGGVAGVTAVAAGSSVSDSVTVASNIQNQPPPTGNVTVNFYGTFDCSGNPLDGASTNALDGNGQALNVHPEGPLSAGLYSYQASYPGSPDGAYTGSTGACEPLRVVNANISITPNGTNRVGQSHTFTAHVNVNDGTGSTPAPDGTMISFTIDSGPGSFTTPNPCTTSGGSGSCPITLTSAVTGVTTVSAHTTLAVDGVSLHRDTNGAGGNSGPATKRWVDARISIAPSATNPVNAPHTFTVTVQKDIGDGNGFVAAANEPVTVTLNPANGANPTPAGPFNLTTNASGAVQVTFTSPTAGQVVGHASSTLSDLGTALPITVATDGTGLNSGDATKTFVDANITISPNGTNRVGQVHVFTAHVSVNDGSGAGFVPAPAGTQISFTIDSGPGSLIPPNPCSTVGASGSCSIALTSAVTGVTTVSAHSTLAVGGVSLTRNTNGSGGNSGPATKTWVDARISIAPSATNAVGQPHTFTVTLQKDTGTGTFVPAAGEHVDVTLTDGGGAAHTAPTGSCTNAGANTDANGQCTITFTSPSAGTVTGHASSTLSVAGSAPFTVATDGTGGNSGDAVKTFVDANIQIGPATATNATGTNHVLTITVNALNGTIDAGPHTATASIVSGPGNFVGGNTCTYTGGGASASCTVTITSSATGTTVVSATSNIPVNGVTVSRTTATNPGPGGSGNASKVWVDANINITPASATNPVGTQHVLTITVNASNGTIDAGPHTATASIVSGPGGFVGSPTCTYTGGAATATCTVTITSNVAGTTVVQATSDIPVNGQTITRTTGTAANTASGGSGNASKTWLAGDANIQITPGTASNAVGTTHTLHCHVNVSPDSTTFSNAPDGTVCTVTITSGPGTPTSQNCATAGGTGTCDVTITSSTPGTSTINASTTVVVNGVSITRTTNGSAGNSGPATKNWVDAYISISPANATNATGTNHVLTITVHAYPAGTNLASGTATAAILAGSVGSFTPAGANSCNYTGGSDTASCTVTITSSVTGTTTVRATSTISFQAAAGSVSRTTGDGYIVPGSSPSVGDSPDAVKHWVDANINISPATANNPVGSNHVLTITVNALGGTIDAGPHTATATIVSGPGSFVGSPTCTYTGGAASASCTVTITSSTAGTTVVSATSNIPVNGQTISRTTGTAANTASGGSGNASKNWGDVTNVTHVRDAAGNDITNTTVTGGTVVHDEATVTRTAGTPAAVPNPSGTVTFSLFANGTCTSPPQSTQTVNVAANGVETSANFTTPVANGSFSYLAVYSGDANYPSKTAACEPFTVVGTPPGQIAPTQTTCSQYTGGTSSTLGSIAYSVQNGKIGQNINPGVFFYFAEIKTTTANQSVTVSQTNNSTNNAALFQIRSASLLTASCGALSNGTVNSTLTGATFTVSTPGTYVIQIKYDSKSIAGTTAPIPANITYSFTTSLGGNTGASVQLVKQ